MTAADSKQQYDVIATKAERFYSQHDWNSAAAMYGLMLDMRPNDTATYCKAITAEGMRGATTEQIRLLNDALKARIPVDSLFSGVQASSFALGQTNLYEKFLLAAREHNSWMARSIDSYLLRYYTFRRNGQKITEYAKQMIAGNSDNESFMYSLAQGLLVDGKTDEAMQVYRKIINNNPNAIEALLYLGNHAFATGDNTTALSMLDRAYALRPTPHVAATISRINALLNNGNRSPSRHN